MLPFSLPTLFIAIQWPNHVHQHWGDEKTQKCPNNFDWDCSHCIFLRINLLKMSCKKLRKWHFWVSKFNNFLGECAPDPCTMGRLHLYNFSPHVRAPSGSLHQYETRVIGYSGGDVWLVAHINSVGEPVLPRRRLRQSYLYLAQTPLDLD